MISPGPWPTLSIALSVPSFDREFAPIRKVIRVVMDRIGEAGERPKVSGVMAQIDQLLDESVAANAYLIGSEERKSLMDLSEVDRDAIMFASGRQRTRRRSCDAC
jgi:hypothetical protein